MRRAAACLSACLLASHAVAAIEAGGRIRRVTVHPDRAEVTRVADVAVPAGSSEIRFTDLPEHLDEDSLVVAARGVSAILGSVELRHDMSSAAPQADLAAAEADIRRIEAETARLAAEEGTDRELRKYLDALRDGAARPPAEAHLAVSPNTDALSRMLAFLRGAHSEIASREVARQSRRVALADELRAAQARRDAARPAPSRRMRSALVRVQASEAGSLRVELSYVVGGASWRPAYRATLDPNASIVHLVSEAVVAQVTGEDWEDVALTLSTSAPDDGLEPPVLVSWMIVPQPLGIAQGVARTETMEVVSGGLALQLPTASIQSFKLITSGASARDAEQSSGVALASVLSTGHDVNYVVPGESDVASDSSEHRLTLRSDALRARLSYRVVPSLSEEAWAIAEVKAPEDRPLLAGGVRVISAGTLLGEFDMEETAPGDDLTIPFGADRRVKVTRIAQPPERSEKGSARDRTVRASFRTTLENRRDAPVRVTLEERVPVSQEERITVKLGEATTEGSIEAEDRPGIRAWELELAPKAARTVTLEYVVRHPRDITISGL